MNESTDIVNRENTMMQFLSEFDDVASVGWMQPAVSNVTERLELSVTVEMTSSDSMSCHYSWPALFLFTIVILAIGGNVLVCVAVRRERKLRSMFNFFLVSLALSDMLSAIFVMPLSIVRTLIDCLPMPKLLCFTWYSLDVFFTSSTICHLCMISIDRYVAFNFPLRYGHAKNKRFTVMKIAIVWVVSFCIAGPLFILSMLDDQQSVHHYKGCGPETQTFVISATVSSFYVPLVIMTVMYALTVHALRRQLEEQRRMTINQQSVSTSSSAAAARRAIHLQPANAGHHQTHYAPVHQSSGGALLWTTSSSGSGNVSGGICGGGGGGADRIGATHHRLEANNIVKSPSVMTSVTGSYAETLQLSPDESSSLGIVTDVTTSGSGRDRNANMDSDRNQRGDNSRDASVDGGCHRNGDMDATKDKESCAGANGDVTGTRHVDWNTEKDVDSTTNRDISGRDRNSNRRLRVGHSSTTSSTNNLDDNCFARRRFKFTPRGGAAVGVRGPAAPARFTDRRRVLTVAAPDRGRRAVRVLGILFVVFVVFYLPFFAVYIVDGTCESCQSYISPRTITAFEWLQYSGSMLNPIVYHVFNPDFRRAFQRILRCHSV